MGAAGFAEHVHRGRNAPKMVNVVNQTALVKNAEIMDVVVLVGSVEKANIVMPRGSVSNALAMVRSVGMTGVANPVASVLMERCAVQRANALR